MPEPIRNRREQTVRETDQQDMTRGRPGFGPGEDPLAELARIVGDTAPSVQAAAPPVTGPRRAADGREPNPAARDFPRRDTSWRDPQARTTVRAGMAPKPMPEQLADLEAELFSEIRSENLRHLPPAPDLAELGLPDARSPQYGAMPRESAASISSQMSRRHPGSAPGVDRSDTRAKQARQDSDPDPDDEVTLPMHAVLRAPAAPRTSEDHRMQQPPRFNPAQVQETPHGVPEAPYDRYVEPARYDDHADYDPAGALGGSAHSYEDAAAEAYYADVHAADPYTAPVAGHGSQPQQYAEPLYADEDEDYGQAYQAPSPVRRPAKRGNPFLTGIVVVIGVAVLGIGGVFTYRAIAGNGATGAYAPLIHADTKPLKEVVAQQPPAASGPNLDAARGDGQDRLVTQAEDPVDHVPGKPVRVVGSNAATPTLAPVQRVRSVIVKPDGTIVTPDDAAPKPLVQTAALPSPVVTDTQPSTPTAASQPPAAALPPLAPVNRIDTAPFAAKPAPTPAPVAAKPAPAPLAAPKPSVADVAPAKPVAKPALVPHAPVPVAGDPNAPMTLGPAPGPAPLARVATANPPPSSIPRAAPVDAGTGDYMVQISAQRSDAEARHALAAAQQKYAALGAKGGDVQQADLGARGTFYRVRLAGGSHEQALALCTQIKAQGGDCMVSRR